jgi:uncharacterized membrane protein
MPYQWISETDPEVIRLRLWPHRSLPQRGFVWFITATALLLALPLITQLGTPGLWVLLPFVLAPLAGVWIALQHSYRITTEDLTLTRDMITLHRTNPRGPAQDWQANPHWVRTSLYASGGPVANYLTLAGSAREVELGAFLAPVERKEIHDRLQSLLAAQNRREP